MVEELVITVAKKQIGDKGGITIVDTLGGEYKVAVKNAGLADALIEGRASKIEIATTTYGKYINKAVLFDGKPPVEKRIAPIAGGDEPSKLAQEAVRQGGVIVDTKTRSMAIAYSKDLVVAKIIELKDMAAYADKFVDYILNIKRKGD